VTSAFDPAVERAILERAAANRQIAQVAESEFDDVAIDALESLAVAFPWLDASTFDALASSGIDSSDTGARRVAGAALAEGMQLGTFTGRPMTKGESLRAALGADGYREYKEMEEAGVRDPLRVLRARSRRAQRSASGSPTSQGGDTASVMGPVLNREPRVDPLTVNLGGMEPINELTDPDNTVGLRLDSQLSQGFDIWKRGAGFLHDKAGDALGAIGLGGGDPIFEQGIKPTVRGAMTVLDLGPQSTQAVGTVVHDAWVNDGWLAGMEAAANIYFARYGLAPDPDVAAEVMSLTDAGVVLEDAIGDIRKGELPRVDLGQGYFTDPESAVAQQRLANSLEFQLVDDQPFSIGRFASTQVFEPGTKQYGITAGLIDLANEIVGPGALAMDGVILQGIRGRRTIDVSRAGDYLNSEEGLQVIEALTDSTDFTYVDKALGGSADPMAVAQIVDANDLDDVAKILKEQLGIEVTELPRLPRFQPQIDWAQDHVPSLRRQAAYVPESSLSITDARQRVDTARRILINSNASAADVSEFTYRFAATNNPAMLKQVAIDMTESIAMRAAEAEGVSDLAKASNAVQYIATVWHRGVQDQTAYWVRELTDPNGTAGFQHMDFWHDIKDGAAKPSPQVYAETLSNNIPMPTARELREMFGNPIFQGWMKAGGRFVQGPADLVLGAVMSAWKATRLLRVAWPVKVLTEGQLRLAFSGYSSLGNHPLDYILHAIGESRRGARGATDITGQYLSASEAMQRAMFSSRDVSRIGEAQRYAFIEGFEPIFKVTPAGAPTDTRLYARHWADQAYRLLTSPEVAMFLRADNFQEASETFWKNMPGVRATLQQGRNANVRDIVNSRADADAFLRQNVEQRIQDLTGGNVELLDVLRTGSLDGYRIADRAGSINRRFLDAVESRIDDLPDMVVGRRVTRSARHDNAADGAVNFMFEWLMTKPSNIMDRSPLFRQQYWRSLERLARSVDPNQAGDLIDNLAKANLSKSQTESITRNLNESNFDRLPTGNQRILTGEEADAVAKAEALHAVKMRLYDLSERNQFFDVTRNIFPFGDAFFEVVSRWIAIMAENPNRLNKAEALLDYAGGYFQENQWGDEVFVYPGSGSLLSGVSGLNMVLEGQTSSLSMFSEMHPGFGPVPQLLASAFLPDEPEFDPVKDFISAGYGLPPNIFDDPVGTAADVMIPPWVSRLVEFSAGRGLTPEEHRIFENHVMEIMNHMIAHDPEWSLETLDSDERNNALVQEARRRAQYTAFIRMAVSFLLPGAPSYQFNTDITGEEMRTWMVQEEYRRLQEEFGVAEAPGEFIDRYGFDAAALINPKSRDLTNGGGTPLHQEGIDWVRENRFAEIEYPQVYGYFAPPPAEEDDLVYSVYVGTFADDPERQALNPRMSLEILQDNTARIVYEMRKEEVLENFDGELTVEAQEYLRGVRDQLKDQFPGYLGVVGRGESVSPEDQIAQLIEAVGDERLKDNPMIEPLTAYLEARQFAVDNAVGAGFEVGGGYDVQLRAWLYETGTIIAEQVPEFAEVWERVLYREFRSAHEQDLEGEN